MHKLWSLPVNFQEFFFLFLSFLAILTSLASQKYMKILYHKLLMKVIFF